MNEMLASRRMTVRLVPWPLLLMALPFLAIAWFMWREGELRGGGLMIFVVPLVVALFFEITTLTVDQDRRQLTLRRARPWGATERSVAFDDIVAVPVEESRSGRSRTYGVAVALRSGERMRLSGSTSSGRGSKERLARKLAEAISLGRGTAVPAALDGAVRESSAGSADGIEWSVEEVDRGGGWELTVFHTNAARLDDAFLLVAPASAKATMPPLGGLLGSLMRAVVQQYLRAMDLSEADLPHMDRTVVLDDDLLARGGFLASTSSPEQARCWLDAGAAAVLADWQRQPLEASGRVVEPYVVLGPGGLRVLFRACLREQDALSRVRGLGLALARAGRR